MSQWVCIDLPIIGTIGADDSTAKHDTNIEKNLKVSSKNTHAQ